MAQLTLGSPTTCTQHVAYDRGFRNVRVILSLNKSNNKFIKNHQIFPPNNSKIIRTCALRFRRLREVLRDSARMTSYKREIEGHRWLRCCGTTHGPHCLRPCWIFCAQLILLFPMASIAFFNLTIHEGHDSEQDHSITEDNPYFIRLMAYLMANEDCLVLPVQNIQHISGATLRWDIKQSTPNRSKWNRHKSYETNLKPDYCKQ